MVCGPRQGATMRFDIDRNASPPTWDLRNRPTPLSEIYIQKILMY